MTIHYATALTLDALTLEVDDLISKGYTPLGSVVLNPSHHSERFIQTMTRREHAIELKPLQAHTASEAPKRKYVRRKPVYAPQKDVQAAVDHTKEKFAPVFQKLAEGETQEGK